MTDIFQTTVLKVLKRHEENGSDRERPDHFIPISPRNGTTKHPGAVKQKHGWPDWDMCRVDAYTS